MWKSLKLDFNKNSYRIVTLTGMIINVAAMRTSYLQRAKLNACISLIKREYFSKYKIQGTQADSVIILPFPINPFDVKRSH